jgi:3-oxo-5-alpha-steroid 4-dehydrogenase 3
MLLFWLHQILTHGMAFEWLATRFISPEQQTAEQTSSDSTRSLLVWTLFFTHSCRRLYESFTFDKRSSSTMWIGHWIMGLLHYFAVTSALWIETAPMLSRQTQISLSLPDIQTLAIQVVPAICLFILLNMSQYRIHKYLYRLPSKPRINVPSKGVFKHAINPHYGSEVGIYACLFWLSSPSFLHPNWTMFSVLCFVAINLGVSAKVTKEKYAASFGPPVVQGKSLFGLPGLCDADLNPLLHKKVEDKKAI